MESASHDMDQLFFVPCLMHTTTQTFWLIPQYMSSQYPTWMS